MMKWKVCERKQVFSNLNTSTACVEEVNRITQLSVMRTVLWTRTSNLGLPNTKDPLPINP
jgi:hypothetical protein